jgi:ribosome-associated protein
MKIQSQHDVNANEVAGEELSKTKLKAQMQDLQDLGIELVRLSPEKLAKFNLPDKLIDAIRIAKKINANAGIRRQYQYIGKLMREVDASIIQNTLADINGESTQSTQLLHESERWRDRLLASDKELEEFISLFPHCDINQLRTLIRVVRKEQAIGKNQNYRKLFKCIRDVIEGGI